MTSLPVTSLTAALLAIMLIILSFVVSFGRMKAQVDLGDGDNAMLIRRIRTQGNFIEYAPTGLIVLGLCELGGTGTALLWTIALLLLAGRLAHAIGMLAPLLPLRAGGMLATYAALLLGAATLLMGYFR